MTAAGSRASFALVALVTLTSGCYRYVPTSVELAPPGDEVRVLVTRLGAAQLTEVMPGSAVTGVVTGKLESIDGDDLLLSVPVGERRDGFMRIDLTQTIRVPRGEVLNLERREFDKTGTAFIGAAAVAVGAGIIFGIIEAFGSPGPPDDGEPPVDFRVMLGQFTLPFGR